MVDESSIKILRLSSVNVIYCGQDAHRHRSTFKDRVVRVWRPFTRNINTFWYVIYSCIILLCSGNNYLFTNTLCN